MLIKNQGTTDRAIRIGVGFLLVAVAFFGPSLTWAGLIGLVVLITGFVGHCPIYRMLGVRTSADASGVHG